MKAFIIALLLTAIFGVASAFSVNPDFIETKDTGQESLPALDVGIAIDCDTKDLTVQVASNDTGEPVGSAQLYLFYTQYEYQLIATGSTTADGSGIVNVIGNRDYLTRLFILRIDKPGYQSREIEFMYEKCFETPPTPPSPPPKNQTGGAGNITPPANNTPPDATPKPNATQPSNATPPAPPAGNNTIPKNNGTGPPATPAPSGPCPAAALVLISLIFLRAGA